MPARKVSDEKIKRALALEFVPVDWTAGDTSALKIWLNSRTGQKLANALRNAAHLEAISACFGPPEKLQEAAGVAKGWTKAFSLLCQMAGTDPLRLVAANGQPTLTESRVEEENEDEDEPSSMDSPSSYSSPISPNP